MQVRPFPPAAIPNWGEAPGSPRPRRQVRRAGAARVRPELPGALGELVLAGLEGLLDLRSLLLAGRLDALLEVALPALAGRGRARRRLDALVLHAGAELLEGLAVLVGELLNHRRAAAERVAASLDSFDPPSCATETAANAAAVSAAAARGSHSFFIVRFLSSGAIAWPMKPAHPESRLRSG